MTSIFHDTLLYLFPKNCFEELFIKLNVIHPECSRIVLSRFLGLGIILGSVMVKLPQLIKIIRARSGQGVSFFVAIFGIGRNDRHRRIRLHETFSFQRMGRSAIYSGPDDFNLHSDS